MLFAFNLQMFDDVEFQGIDSDVLEQFKDELPNKEGNADELASADTRSDNNEVQQGQQQQSAEEEPTAEEEPREGSNIPYSRFKGVNDRMKSAESRVKELEAQLASLQNPTSATQEEQASPAPAPPPKVDEEFNAEQLKAIVAEARRRAAQQLQLTPQDIENLEYDDDESTKSSYEALSTQLISDVKKEALEYRQQQLAYIEDVKYASNQYAELVKEFRGLPNYDVVWEACQKAAMERGPQFAMAAQAALNRLDVNRGTSQDYYFISDFARGVLKNFNANSAKAPTPTKTKNTKIQEAAKLPVAPSVGGSTKGDIVWDVATITDYVNAGRMDEIPKDVLRNIMGASMASGDMEV
jgi:hypothetical protein